jgi:hypothetical protein
MSDGDRRAQAVFVFQPLTAASAAKPVAIRAKFEAERGAIWKPINNRPYRIR